MPQTASRHPTPRRSQARAFDAIHDWETGLEPATLSLSGLCPVLGAIVLVTRQLRVSEGGAIEALFLIGLWLVFFIASIKMAQRRGRDAWIWGFFGLVFGLFAVLVLWALGDTKEQQRAKLAAREAEQLDPTR